MFYKWEGVVPVEECNAIIEKYKNGEYKEAEVGDRCEVNTEVRKTCVKWIPTESLINRAISSFTVEANNKFFKYDISGAERTQFAKYESGYFYDWHTDTSNPLEKETRKLTTIIQLSDPNDYEGGVFQFFKGMDSPESPPIEKQGSVIVFDSREWHRLTEVTKGIRYSLVQWTTGGRFI